MGWFGSLFSKRKEDIDILKEHDLDDWFEEHLGDREAMLKEDAAGYLKKIESIYEALDSHLDKLDHTQSPGEGRSAELFHSNKDEFVEEGRRLIYSLRIPDKTTYASLSQFIQQFEESWNEFATKSAKSSQVLGDDVSFINELFDSLNEEVREIPFSHFSEVHEARSLLDEYKSILNKKREARSLLQDQKASLKEVEAQLASLKRQAEQMENDPSFGAVQELRKDKEAIESRLKAQESAFKDKFVVLAKPLLIYVGETPVPLVNDYINDPMNALMNDEDLSILSLIESMADKVREGEIEIGNPDEVVAVADELTEKKLESIRGNYAEAKRSASDIKRRISRHALLFKYDEKMYKLQHEEEKQEKILTNIEKLEKYIGSEEERQVLDRLQEKLSDLFDKSIVIE